MHGRGSEAGGVSLSWFRIAVIYFVLAVGLGVLMGARGDFSLVSVHAHMNLLGWEALALMGLIYHFVPGLGANKVARTHFWLHNIGLPVMMLALVMKEQGNPAAEPILGVASTVVGAAVLLFALNVLFNIGGRRADRQLKSAAMGS